ncbi:MAG: iron-containing alcohol dehydrogenase [Candidatus Humimicrobiaceae bacterium]
MENFMWDGASRVIFGKGVENEAGKWIKKYGGTKVLLHYGLGSIKKTGLYEKVINQLKDENISVVELGGVKPNPVLSLVREGVKLCKDQKVDFILAVGGGSVIDSAKAIAVGAFYEGDVWDFAEGKAYPGKALPIGVILTIPAAGSETSRYTVITKEEGLLKKDVVVENNEIIRPKFAIMNPELTFTLPPYQTACGIADIMAHVMERYFSKTKHVDLSDKLCEAIIKSVIKNGPMVLKEPNNYDARAEIMWAGSVAHNDLVGMGRDWDFVSHRIGVELSAIYDITHGASLSIALPAWMKYMYRINLDVFKKFAVNVWGIEYDFDNPENTAIEGIKRLESFYKGIGLPTRLSEANIPTDRFDEIAEKTDKIGSIKKIDKNDVLEILKLAQ